MNAQATVSLEKAKRRAAVAFDSGSVGDRLLPAPALGGGGGRVPRPRRALTGGRVRALRARARSSSRGSTRKPHHTSSWHDPCARARNSRKSAPSSPMRACRPACAEASVIVDGEVVGACGAGLAILLGVAATDTEADAERMAAKVARLRIFENDAGKFDLSPWTFAERHSPSASSRSSQIANVRRELDRTSPRPPGPRSPSHCTSTSSRRSAVSEFRRRRDLRREDGGHDRERWAGDDRARCVAVRTGRLATGRVGCHASVVIGVAVRVHSRTGG